MLAPHKIVSVKKSNSKGLAEMNKKVRNAIGQRNKRGGGDHRRGQAAHDRSEEYFDPVAAEKHNVSQHWKEHGARLRDNVDVNLNLKFTYRVEKRIVERAKL